MGTDTEIDNRYKTIFFDGECNLCNGLVNFIIDRDKKGRFTFASLQSGYATQVFRNTKIDPKRLDGLVYKREGVVHSKSDAVLEIARDMGFWWSMFYPFKIIPRFLRDWIYDIIAQNRYKWFGKQSTCRLPGPELQERFLDSKDVF